MRFAFDHIFLMSREFMQSYFGPFGRGRGGFVTLLIEADRTYIGHSGANARKWIFGLNSNPFQAFAMSRI